MTTIHIRPAAREDLTALVELENLTFDYDQMQRHHYRRLLAKPSALILVAEQEKKIIGSLLVLFRKNSTRARIYSLAVNHAYRQAGIAQKLCAVMEQEMIKKNCDSVVLEVRTDNHSAIRFYEKNGYDIFGSYSKFYEDGTDALRMRKIL